MRTILNFICAMVLSFIPGAVGVIFTPGAGGDAWFDMINKSLLTPAGWVFGVAWTVLYTILGVALFMIIQRRTNVSRGGAYALFGAHMILNALWSYLFFGAHLTGAALICLALLILVAWFMMRAFHRVSRAGAHMIWPYIIWMLFAFYLNAYIVMAN